VIDELELELEGDRGNIYVLSPKRIQLTCKDCVGIKS